MVMVIIVLLAGMISPAVNWTIKVALAAKGQTRIDRLANGLVAYKSEWRKYPGQDLLDGNGQLPAGYTGSQILAAAMYDYVYTASATQTEIELDPQSKYAEYFRHQTDTEHEDNSLFVFDAAGANERECALSDGFWTAKMPICYYVSVPGVYYTNPGAGQASFLTQFRYSHNSTFTDAAIDFPAFLGMSQGEVDGLSAAALAAECQDAFQNWVAHTKFTGRPYNDGGFLLMSAGPDRTWFTDDDGKNWTTGD